MYNSKLPLDIFPLILAHVDWFSLQNLQKVNNFFYRIARNEKMNRMKSIFPFGDKNGKIEVVINDIYLESISCMIDNKRIFIPKEKYTLPWIRNTINQWFLFSFINHNLNLTGKLFKSIIRILNKKFIGNSHFVMNEKRQVLLFKYKSCKTILEDVF